MCTIMQNFTLIGVTVAEISVTEQKDRVTANDYTTKRTLALRLSYIKCVSKTHIRHTRKSSYNYVQHPVS